jgi:hypothetical protein
VRTLKGSVLLVMVMTATLAAEGKKSTGAEYRMVLEKKISWDTATAPPAYQKNWNGWTVQWAVRAILGELEVPFQGPRSWEGTKPECFRYITEFKVQEIKARDALLRLLAPVGLTYDVDEAGVYLLRATASQRRGDIRAGRTPAPPAPPLRWAWQTKQIQVWEERLVNLYSGKGFLPGPFMQYSLIVGGLVQRVQVPRLQVEGTLRNEAKKRLLSASLWIRIWTGPPAGLIWPDQWPKATHSGMAEVKDVAPGATVAWFWLFREHGGTLGDREYVTVDLVNPRWEP